MNSHLKFAIAMLEKGPYTIARSKLIGNLKKAKRFNQKTKDELMRTYLYDRLEELENGPGFGLFGMGKAGAIEGIKEDIIQFERKHR